MPPSKIGSLIIPAKIFWKNFSEEEDLNQSCPIRDSGMLLISLALCGQKVSGGFEG
jgi:hypothetical protein